MASLFFTLRISVLTNFINGSQNYHRFGRNRHHGIYDFYHGIPRAVAICMFMNEDFSSLLRSFVMTGNNIQLLQSPHVYLADLS